MEQRGVVRDGVRDFGIWTAIKAIIGTNTITKG